MLIIRHTTARRRAATAAAALAAAAAVAGLGASSAQAFGTVSFLNQQREHERVTRIGLQCGPTVQPPDCFQPKSLDNLAGKATTFGAVGAPDDIPMHLKRDREYWHCDNADWVDPLLHGLEGPYPQSRYAAFTKLRDCMEWGRDMLYDGSRDRVQPTATPTWGAIASARYLIREDGGVDTSNPGVSFFSTTCTYRGVYGRRPKCNTLEAFGYVLHMAEDFYAHTNWGDYAAPGGLSLKNPIGNQANDIAPFLRLSGPLVTIDRMPMRFTGGCFPNSECRGRVRHGESNRDKGGLNKDRARIDTKTGRVKKIRSPRGKITAPDGVTNEQRAVSLAAKEARRQWTVFQQVLIARHDPNDAGKLACILTIDRAEVCTRARPLVVVETGARAGTRAASAADRGPAATDVAAQLIDRLPSSDRVAVISYDGRSGAQDVDPFVAPDSARVDDAVAGDPESDPSAGAVAADVLTPSGQPLLASAAGGATSGAGALARRDDAAAAALRSADRLLDDADVPRGQQGVVLVADSVGDAGALAQRIRGFGARGAVVTYMLAGSDPEQVPAAVIAAVEATGGTAMASRDDADVERFAGVAQASGLTRLSQALPQREPTLTVGAPPLLGVTERGPDVHGVRTPSRDATVTVRALDGPLTVRVLDVTHARTRTARATDGGPARLTLRAGGVYEVHVTGPDGRRYDIELRG